MNISKLVFVALMMLMSYQAFALGPLYLDFHATAGKGSSAIEGEDKSPDVMMYGVGTTLGLKLAMFYVGGSADWYKVAQTTKPDDSFGNRGGSRVNMFSPTVGLRLGSLNLKFDYQFMGDYELDKKTSSGEKLTYTDPSGYRLYLGYNFQVGLEVGAFYESVSYGKEERGSSKTTLDDPLVLSQMGLAFTILL